MRRHAVPQSDDLSYRDYLLVIVDELVSKPALKPTTEFMPAPTQTQIRQRTLDDLKKLFKQDFSVTAETVISANVVAIEVMTAVLTEDLGFTAGALPVGGSKPDRLYLEDLIVASGQEKETLVAKYGINLSRTDTEHTTRTNEQILALQHYLRDGDFGLYDNPFFLYRDEWRSHRTMGSFPENQYSLRTGLFASSAQRTWVGTLVGAVKAAAEFATQGGWLKPFMSRLGLFGQLDTHLREGHAHFSAGQLRLAASKYRACHQDLQRLRQALRIKVWVLPEDGKTIDERTWTLDPFDAKAFRSALDPSNAYPGKRIYGKRPPWGGPYWDPWTSMAGGSNVGNWQKYKNTDAWSPVDVSQKKIPKRFPFTPALFGRLSWRYDTRAKLQVDNVAGLDALEERNVFALPTVDLSGAGYLELERQLVLAHDELLSLVLHVAGILLPMCEADLAASAGDYMLATRHFDSAQREQLLRASLQTTTPQAVTSSEDEGDLPWNWTDAPGTRQGSGYPYLNEDVEGELLKLRIGSLYLAWADELYRSDQEPEVFRARELYKAVLNLYDIDPLPKAELEPLAFAWSTSTDLWGSLSDWIDPEVFKGEFRPVQPSAGTPAGPTIRRSDRGGVAVRERENEFSVGAAVETVELAGLSAAAASSWKQVIDAGLSPAELAQPDPDFSVPFLTGASVVGVLLPLVNPAMLAQQEWARLAITQIDTGLNYFGYGDQIVPMLRYKPLAAAARSFAILAKQAESDFLDYREKAEQQQLGLMEARTALSTAALRVQIESHRILQANDLVIQAEAQVAEVKAQIAKKKAEIQDGNSVCTQFKDWFKGLIDFFSGTMPSDATKAIKSDYSAAFGFSAAKGTAGLGVVGGMAAYGVGTAVTLSGMADAANRRLAELKDLEERQLVAALAGLDARKLEVAVAQTQKAIAVLQTMAARDVVAFSTLRSLNADTWNWLAVAMQGVVRRYLDLGTMTGWMAERALSYEQDRDIRMIRFSYYKPKRMGLLGADELQLDLAALAQESITGYQATVPIEWKVSLAADHPLEFGQLKQRGSCAFVTSSAPLDRAYPGTYAFRIRAVDIAAMVPVTTPPPKGSLSNLGLSYVVECDPGAEHMLVRPLDMSALSEFQYADDMAIYALPGEGLLPFEGSGIDTTWVMELPELANPNGLDDLVDIVVTFHLQAQYSAVRRARLADQPAPPIRRSALVSAKRLQEQEFTSFLTSPTHELTFDLKDGILPDQTMDRTINNVAIFFAGRDLPDISGTLEGTGLGTSGFTTADGMAYSNMVPQGVAAPATASTLNTLVTGPPGSLAPNRQWKVTVKEANNAGLVWDDLEDVILGIEYEAAAPTG